MFKKESFMSSGKRPTVEDMKNLYKSIDKREKKFKKDKKDKDGN